MVLLFLVVAVIYLILALIFRDKTVNLEEDSEVAREFVLNYLANKQIFNPGRVEKIVEHSQNNHGMNLLAVEKTKRRLMNETFLLGVMSGTRLKDKREKYIQLK